LKKFSLKSIKVSRVLQILAVCVCGAILGVNIYLANAKTFTRNRLPMPFGIGAATVLSGSMEPEMSKGDLIFVKKTDDIAVDDIVVYDNGSELIVHRVIKIEDDMVTTQGDANPSADAPINIKYIKGEIVFTVPFVGKIIDFIKTPVGTIIILALAIALLEIPRLREKKKDTEEIDKIKEEIRKLEDEIKKIV